MADIFNEKNHSTGDIKGTDGHIRSCKDTHAELYLMIPENRKLRNKRKDTRTKKRLLNDREKGEISWVMMCSGLDHGP